MKQHISQHVNTYINVSHLSFLLTECMISNSDLLEDTKSTPYGQPLKALLH